MTNLAFDDMVLLRQTVVRLIHEGRVQLTNHALETHQEISPQEKIEAVLKGGSDQPSRPESPRGPRYVCWSPHPQHGLLRAVYAIRQTPFAGAVVVITVFKE